MADQAAQTKVAEAYLAEFYSSVALRDLLRLEFPNNWSIRSTEFLSKAVHARLVLLSETF